MKFTAKNLLGLVGFFKREAEGHIAQGSIAATKKAEEFYKGKARAIDDLADMIQQKQLQLEVEIAACRAREFLLSIKQDYRSADIGRFDSILSQLNECLTIQNWEDTMEWERMQKVQKEQGQTRAQHSGNFPG